MPFLSVWGDCDQFSVQDSCLKFLTSLIHMFSSSRVFFLQWTWNGGSFPPILSVDRLLPKTFSWNSFPKLKALCDNSRFTLVWRYTLHSWATAKGTIRSGAYRFIFSPGRIPCYGADHVVSACPFLFHNKVRLCSFLCFWLNHCSFLISFSVRILPSNIGHWFPLCVANHPRGYVQTSKGRATRTQVLGDSWYVNQKLSWIYTTQKKTNTAHMFSKKAAFVFIHSKADRLLACLTSLIDAVYLYSQFPSD